MLKLLTCRGEQGGQPASTSALEAFLDSAADPLRPHRSGSGLTAAASSGAAEPGRQGSGRDRAAGQYERYGLAAPSTSTAAAGALCAVLSSAWGALCLVMSCASCFLGGATPCTVCALDLLVCKVPV